jgi:ornithine--oxo-acid transaminase
MEGNIDKVNKPLAERQWQHLRDTISQFANVVLIEPQFGLPDMVFTANSAIINHNNNTALIAAFKHHQRHDESQHFQRWFSDAGFATVEDYTVPHEGAGDCLVDRYGEYWFGYGQRSHKGASEIIQQEMDVPFIHKLELVDPRWYHLDTAFCPLDNGYYMACRAAFSDGAWAYLLDVIGLDKLISISESDGEKFVCNAVSIGDRIVMPLCSTDLRLQLNRLGFDVYQCDMSEFLKSGGAAKCLVLEIKH